AQAPQPRSEPAPAAPARPADPAAGAKALFSRILEGVQKEKPALAAILAQYSSFGIGEDSIEIAYEGERKFYGPTVRRDTKLVEKIASDAAGRPMRLRLVEREGPAPQTPRAEAKATETESALKDPTVRFFMDTFKAKVVSVDPVKKPPEGK
ncbi:MAG TPA: hypothetical protein VHP61_07755, partial [Acidobacteriota bacterium]|nr:hypothetical protein [Acidobacteriota bacterium]